MMDDNEDERQQFLDKISAAEKAMHRNTARIESLELTKASIEHRLASAEKVTLEADRLKREAGDPNNNAPRGLNDFYADIETDTESGAASVLDDESRNKVLYGGRSSSKSWDAAGFAIYLADHYPLRFLCTRQIQNKIEESVYALLKIQINRFGLRHRFRILDNKIINRHTGAEFIFYGLWRHIEEIKSLESVDVLWNEEAHAITEAQWEILEPTIRKGDLNAGSSLTRVW
jgi:hypothetical protein